MIENYLIFSTIFYMLCAILFIVGLKLLGSPDTAKFGNILSSIGMLLSVFVVMSNTAIVKTNIFFICLLFGIFFGLIGAYFVKMTEMPQMIALLNGFGGLSSLLVGWSIHCLQKTPDIFNEISIVLSIIIGGITFAGSIIAFAKLHEMINGKPLLLPKQKELNILIVLTIIFCSIKYVIYPETSNFSLYFLIILSFLFGIFSVMPIGGADMPVVISLLNSYSGIAAAATGFVVKNILLIIAGSLVGASGIILTSIMCKAMNRSLFNVLFSGFFVTTNIVTKTEKNTNIQVMNPKDASYILEAARSIVIVPGFGLAVAQAQHVLKELNILLEKNGTDVKYAIHPVAGRMPGHMNVLLAEANISYNSLVEMDDINKIIDNIDVCIVIGANDVVNTAARDDNNSLIFGMPIINIDKAKIIFILKRSMASGFAGIDNPVFFNPNTYMIFGDAKQTLQQLIVALKQ